MPDDRPPEKRHWLATFGRNLKALFTHDVGAGLDYLTPKTQGLSRWITRLDERDKRLSERGKQQDAQMRELEEQHQRRLENVERQCARLLQASFDPDPWLQQAKNRHQGERCFLLGCGPSLNRVDLSRLKGERTMGVNGCFLLDDVELDYFITVSHFFWKHHTEDLITYRCQRRFLPPYLKALESDCPTSWLRIVDKQDTAQISGETPWLFSRQADRFVVIGGTVLFVALQILYHLGFSQVIALGLDHDYGLEDDQVDDRQYISTDDLQAHFRPDYYQPGEKIHYDLPGMERAYRLAHQAFTEDGREILNASPGTKLDTFPKVEYDRLF